MCIHIEQTTRHASQGLHPIRESSEDQDDHRLSPHSNGQSEGQHHRCFDCNTAQTTTSTDSVVQCGCGAHHATLAVHHTRHDGKFHSVDLAKLQKVKAMLQGSKMRHSKNEILATLRVLKNTLLKSPEYPTTESLPARGLNAGRGRHGDRRCCLAKDPTHVSQALGTLNVCLYEVHYDPTNDVIECAVIVRDLTYHKTVFSRVTATHWTAHRDIAGAWVDRHNVPVDNRCEEQFRTELFRVTIPLSGLVDRRNGKLRDVAEIEFAMCFKAGNGEYWDNNAGRNYYFKL